MMNPDEYIQKVLSEEKPYSSADFNKRVPDFVSGDLLLTREDNKISKSLNLFQRLSTLRIWGPCYSHVAFSLGSGLFIESDLEGVHLTCLNEISERLRKTTLWKAIRFKEFAKKIEYNNKFSHEIENKALFYLEQPYNYFFGFWKLTKDKTSFCSELACKVYKDFGYTLKKSHPSRVFPIHFYKISNSTDWIDITPDYKAILFSKKYAHLLDLLIEHSILSEKVIKETRTITIEHIASNSLMNSWAKSIGRDAFPLELSANYWDVFPNQVVKKKFEIVLKCLGKINRFYKK
jgi:hypothetical protein